MEEIVTTITVVVMIILSVLLGLALFNNKIDDSWRQQIADHGCGEFYLDQKHDRQWRWK